MYDRILHPAPVVRFIPLDRPSDGGYRHQRCPAISNQQSAIAIGDQQLCAAAAKPAAGSPGPGGCAADPCCLRRSSHLALGSNITANYCSGPPQYSPLVQSCSSLHKNRSD